MKSRLFSKNLDARFHPVLFWMNFCMICRFQMISASSLHSFEEKHHPWLRPGICPNFPTQITQSVNRVNLAVQLCSTAVLCSLISLSFFVHLIWGQSFKRFTSCSTSPHLCYALGLPGRRCRKLRRFRQLTNCSLKEKRTLEDIQT